MADKKGNLRKYPRTKTLFPRKLNIREKRFAILLFSTILIRRFSRNKRKPMCFFVYFVKLGAIAVETKKMWISDFLINKKIRVGVRFSF